VTGREAVLLSRENCRRLCRAARTVHFTGDRSLPGQWPAVTAQGNPSQLAPFRQIKFSTSMQSATIVPDKQISNAPAVRIHEVLLFG
jgi:hypothetical protein